MTDQEALVRFEGDLEFMQTNVTPGHTTNQMAMYERAIDALKFKIAAEETANKPKCRQSSWTTKLD